MNILHREYIYHLVKFVSIGLCGNTLGKNKISAQRVKEGNTPTLFPIPHTITSKKFYPKKDLLIREPTIRKEIP